MSYSPISVLIDNVILGLSSEDIVDETNIDCVSDRYLSEICDLALETKTFLHFAKGILPRLSGKNFEYVREKLTLYEKRTLARNSCLLIGANRAANILENNQIPYAFFKGPFQQHSIYGSYFTRGSADLDILVERNNFSKIVNIFQKNEFLLASKTPFGYWSVFKGELHLADLITRKWFLDVHHKMQPPGLQQPKSISVFLEDTKVDETTGNNVKILSSKKCALVISMNLAKALYRGEKGGFAHLCDLYTLINNYSEASISICLSESELHDIRGTMLLSVRLLDIVFGMSDLTSELRNQARQVLSEISDQELIERLIYGGEPHWPSQLGMIAATCEGQFWRRNSESLNYCASEISRKLERLFKVYIPLVN